MEPHSVHWSEAPPSGWRELLAADPGAAPSAQPEVVQALASSLTGMRAMYCWLEREGVLLGGAPAIVERRAGAEWLHALPMMLSGAPIARSGAHATVDAAVAAAFAARVRDAAMVGGAWSCYRPVGPPVPEAALDSIVGETRWIEAALVPLGEGVDGALRRIERKARQTLAQTLQRVLVFEEDPTALEPAYALHLAQRVQWGAARALPLELSRRLLVAEGHVARLFTVRDARGLLAASLVLDGPHETFLWWSGTHRDGRRSQAFTRLVWGIVEWAAARGRARVDLGASTGLSLVADFKRSLGAVGSRYPVRWLAAGSSSGWPHTLARLQAWVRRDRPRGASA